MAETAPDRVEDRTDGSNRQPGPSDYLPPVGKRYQSSNGSRQDILARRIFDLLTEQPGVLQKDVFRLVGEKDILVLSLLDQLVVEDLIERRGEPTRLYLVGEAPPEPAAPPTDQNVRARPKGRFDFRAENALTLIDLYRLCRRKLGLRVELGGGLRAYRGDRKVLAASFGSRGSELTLYGLKPELLAELEPKFQSSSCKIEECEPEGSVCIRSHTRASLLELLPVLTPALVESTDAQKKAAER